MKKTSRFYSLFIVAALLLTSCGASIKSATETCGVMEGAAERYSLVFQDMGLELDGCELLCDLPKALCRAKTGERFMCNGYHDVPSRDGMTPEQLAKRALQICWDMRPPRTFLRGDLKPRPRYLDVHDANQDIPRVVLAQ